MAILAGKYRRELVGLVTSDKMDKTLVVTVDEVKMHKLYNKRFVVKKKYYVHDENNTAKLGDKVLIREMKPMSKLKRWKFIEVVVAAATVDTAEEVKAAA